MAFPRRAMIPLLFFSLCIAPAILASQGDADPLYRDCVKHCEKTGCVGSQCFQNCKLTSDGNFSDGQWYLQEPLYLKWKDWDCLSDCRYNCMLAREEERKKLGEEPIKYHRRWPFRRVYGIQEPVSVALSSLNLAIQFHGWMSFFILVYYKLPLRDRKTYYEFTGLCHIYGILAMNSLFWTAVFHGRDLELAEKLYYSSTAALIGFGLLFSILRIFNVYKEATRVMIAAPIIAFVTTHILFLNIYRFDYGLNKVVCVTLGTAQLLVWAVWAVITRSPSRWKLLSFVVIEALSTVFKIYDFPPYLGLVDAHTVCHAIAIPMTYLWWSFIKDDAEFRTSTLLKKSK